MKTKKQSNIVLVYDRYYGKKPSPFIQSLKKTLYCTALCIFAMLFIAEEYKMPVNLWAVAGLSALFSVMFCVTFSFIRKKIAIPIFLFFSGIIILFNQESLWERISYFTDLFWMRLNGIMFYTERYTFHIERQLVGSFPPCADGALLGIAAVCCIFALLTAACMFRKPVIFPSFFVFILLSAPVAVAGNFEFNIWIIPAAALYVGAVALSKPYADGAAVKKGFIGSFRAEARKEEREFRNKAAKTPFIKRVGMNGVYYSKYISTACLGAVIFSAAAFIANCFAPVKEGFDYKDFYSFLNSLTQNSGISSPFENGPVSEYFTAYGSGSSSLNIVSPGNGQQEILRVSSPGSEVYLRGDIGIDFTGNSWTSPIKKESPLWKKGKLREKYRPAEMRILQIMEQSYREDLEEKSKIRASDYSGDNNKEKTEITADYIESLPKIPDENSIVESEVIVNYLCQTDVVFLPAYPSEFGFFENEMFDVYGDFSVRVNENYDKINSVKVDALVPAVAYSGGNSGKQTEVFSYLADAAENYPMSDIFDKFFDEDGIYLDYRDYVYGTYLNVPNSLRSDIHRYLLENGLYTNVYSGGKIDIKAGYEAAVKITDYMLDNYTYSLDAKKNPSNPIMTFLNDTKSGHCALFASSMTMMLRDMGIPARYCTGFVAPKTREGQFAVLRSKNLHAWCEAYFDGIGWVTFDPTSSSVAGMVEIEGENNSSEEQSDSSESSESGDSSTSIDSDNSEDPNEDPDESDDDSDLTHEGNNDNSDSSSENSKINIVPFILIALAVIAVSSCVVLVIVKFKKLDSQAKRALKDARYNGNSEELYAKIIAVLNLCGFEQRPGEQPKQFFARADAHFKTKLSKNSKLLMKLAFGKDETSPEELLETALLLEGLFTSADAQLVAFARVKLRKIILSKK